jgi:hypothetical protein
MNLNAPQQQAGQRASATENLNVTLKMITFVRDDSGGAL